MLHLVGLHVNQDPGHLGDGGPDGGLHPAAQDVGIVEGEGGIGLHMQVDEVLQAGLADLEFLDVADVGRGPRGLADALQLQPQLCCPKMEDM